MCKCSRTLKRATNTYWSLACRLVNLPFSHRHFNFHCVQVGMQTGTIYVCKCSWLEWMDSYGRECVSSSLVQAGGWLACVAPWVPLGGWLAGWSVVLPMEARHMHWVDLGLQGSTICWLQLPAIRGAVFVS